MCRKDIWYECGRLVQELRLPVPFSARKLCEQVGAARGREIRVIPMVELPSRLYGLTEMREELDIIRYQPYTTALHQEHIILHELAHLLLGHDPARLHRIVFPSLDPKMVATVLGQTNYLGRTTYEERVEYEAEYVATRILERARRLPDRSPAEYPGRNSRLERTLGRRPR